MVGAEGAAVCLHAQHEGSEVLREDLLCDGAQQPEGRHLPCMVRCSGMTTRTMHSSQEAATSRQGGGSRARVRPERPSGLGLGLGHLALEADARQQAHVLGQLQQQ